MVSQVLVSTLRLVILANLQFTRFDCDKLIFCRREKRRRDFFARKNIQRTAAGFEYFLSSTIAKHHRFQSLPQFLIFQHPSYLHLLFIFPFYIHFCIFFINPYFCKCEIYLIYQYYRNILLNKLRITYF